MHLRALTTEERDKWCKTLVREIYRGTHMSTSFTEGGPTDDEENRTRQLNKIAANIFMLTDTL